MKRFISILLIFMVIVSLFIGCSNSSVNKGKEINSIEVIRQSDKKKWTLSDKDTVDQFVKALNNRQKTNAKLDIRPADYSVNIYFMDKSNDEYMLWVDEDINVQGVLMEGDTTWFVNKESNSIFKDILK